MEHNVTLFDRVFATTIAYVLPGMIVIAGAATTVPVVAGWFGSASASPSIVGFLFVLAAALAIGMVLSAVRWWFFEAEYGGKPIFIARSGPINEAKRTEQYAAYEDLRFQHYYYYLAFGNMAMAIPFAITIWLGGEGPPWRLALAVWGLGGLLTAVLIAAARESIRRYVDRRERLLGAMPTEGEAAQG